MPRPPDLRTIARLARSAGICLALIAATAILLLSVERHYPIRHWLFWRYLNYWLAAGAWSFGCAATGHTLLRLILRRPLPWLEQLALGFALGVLAFQLVMFGLGMLGLYHPITFVATPLVFLALGGRCFYRSLARGWVHLRPSRRVASSPVTWIAIAFGLTALIALYLPVMSPLNSSFDARWRHLYIAEQYVVEGGIRRFAEGWTLGASPHFTSLLYTWGFLLPKGLLFDRVELCAHIEFVVFLWTTLVCVPALVRRLVPGANLSAVWAVRFLFPGTFLYDSNLSVGADHIGAVFAGPLLLACLRMWRRPSSRHGFVLGLLIAAAVCAKETTALLLAPFPILLVAFRFVIDAARSVRDRRALARLGGGVVAGLTTIVFTTPHWLKNILWYGDPLYPNLYALMPGAPWGPHAAYAFEHGFKTMLWAPTRDLEGLRQAVLALFTFSFKPYAWWSMHRDVPVFGSLFTLTLLVLLFLRGTRRVWFVVAAVHLSLFCWFWVHHEERHLQALVPWMAASLAATLTLVWRSGRGIVRTCLAVLVGAQAVWGADIYFYPTHSMISGPAIKAPVELLAQGYLLNWQRRFDYQLQTVLVGQALPKDAVILLHETRDHLGYGRKLIADHTGDQYGIDYLELGSPDRIHRALRELGVTHVVWTGGQSVGIATLGADIAFFEYATRYLTDLQRIGAAHVAALPKQPPRAPDDRIVAVLGCDVAYPTGLYQLGDLDTPRFGPNKRQFPTPRQALEAEPNWPERVFAVAVDPTCAQPKLPPSLFRDFERVAKRGERWGRGHEIWIRK